MRRTGWMSALLFSIPACASPAPAAVDAEATDGAVDAATHLRDGGDASASADTGALADGATLTDGGTQDDAGARDDAAFGDDAGGIGVDASGTTDAAASDDAGGIGSDAGAGMDGGGAPDTGIASDAGAGRDAAMTTCDLTVSPTMGPASTSFEFRASTNGTSCRASLDGGPPLVVPCAGMLSMGGFALGMHEVTLEVSGGPSGTTTCSASFTVVELDAGTAGDAGATSCSIEVLPASGSVSTTFTATFASNGSACTLSVDGFGLGSVPCVGSYAGSGMLVGPGTHVVALDSASGPSGPAHCTSTFVVTP